MLDLGNLRVGIVVDDDGSTKKLSGFNEEVKNVNTNISKTGEKLKSFGNGMSGIGKDLSTKITLPIVAAGTAAIKMGSDFEESINKVDVTFKDNAKEIKEWSETSLEKMGMAQATALEMSALFGDMGQGMGLSSEATKDYSMSLTQLAADLSSFKNVSIDRAQTALTGIYTGETEALKSLGIVMTEVNLQEFANAQGIKTKVADMTQAEKVQLRYNFVMEQTKNAHGDFANTSDSTSNSIKILVETTKELSTELGQVLLPIVTPIIQSLTEWVQKFMELDTSIQTIIIAIAAVSAVIPPLLIVLGTMISSIGTIVTAIGTASTAIGGFGAVIGILTSPITLVVAAVAGFIAILVTLYNTNDDVRKAIDEIWGKIKEIFSLALDAIEVTINGWIDFFKDVWDKWGNEFELYIGVVWKNIENVFALAFNAINNILSIFIDLFKGDWGALWDDVKKLGIDLWNDIKKLCSEWLDGLIAVVVGFGTQMFESGSKLFNELWNGVKNIWEQLTTWASEKLDGLIVTVSGFGDKMFSAGASMFNSLWNGIKSVWNGISDWVSEKVGWLADKITFWDNGKNKVDGSHRTGLTEVPNDGYLAELHKGEMVLTQNEASLYRKNKSTSQQNINVQTDNSRLEGLVSELIIKVDKIPREFKVNDRMGLI